MARIGDADVIGIYLGSSLVVEGRPLPSTPPATRQLPALVDQAGNSDPSANIVEIEMTLERGWYEVELAGCGGGGGGGCDKNSIGHPGGNGGAGGYCNVKFTVQHPTTITLTIGTPGQGGKKGGTTSNPKGGNGGKGAFYTEVEAPVAGIYNNGYYIGYGALRGAVSGIPPLIALIQLENVMAGGGACGIGGGDAAGKGNMFSVNYALCLGGAGGSYGKAADGYSDYSNSGGIGNSGGGGAGWPSGVTYSGGSGGGGGGATILYISDEQMYIAGGGAGGHGGPCDAEDFDETMPAAGAGSNNLIPIDSIPSGGGGAGGTGGIGSLTAGEDTGTDGANGGAGYAKLWKLV